MKRSLSTSLLLLVLSQGSSYANGSPDAGSMLSNTELGMNVRAEKQLEGFPAEYYPKLRWTDEFSIQVEQIDIQGNTRIPPERLQAAVSGYVGKRIMVEKLSSVSAAVAKTYKDAGWRVKAYIPEQSFSRGHLIVQVIEAGSYR